MPKANFETDKTKPVCSYEKEHFTQNAGVFKVLFNLYHYMTFCVAFLERE